MGGAARGSSASRPATARHAETNEREGERQTHDEVGDPGALLSSCSRSLAAARAFLTCAESGAPSLCVGTQPQPQSASFSCSRRTGPREGESARRTARARTSLPPHPPPPRRAARPSRARRPTHARAGQPRTRRRRRRAPRALRLLPLPRVLLPLLRRPPRPRPSQAKARSPPSGSRRPPRPLLSPPRPLPLPLPHPRPGAPSAQPTRARRGPGTRGGPCARERGGRGARGAARRPG